MTLVERQLSVRHGPGLRLQMNPDASVREPHDADHHCASSTCDPLCTRTRSHVAYVFEPFIQGPWGFMQGPLRKVDSGWNRYYWYAATRVCIWVGYNNLIFNGAIEVEPYALVK